MRSLALCLVVLGCGTESASQRLGDEAQAGATASGGSSGEGGNAVAGSSAAGTPGAGGAGAAGAAGSSGSGGSDVGGAAAGGAGGEGGAGPNGTPIFVAVGYSGRTIRSTDLGLTWIDDKTLGGGGDDEFLLRGVGFGQGVFVAVGWKILTSPDGDVWTERDNPQNQWLGSVQLGPDGFVATGGYGYCASSSDGISWDPGGTVPNNEASRSLAFGLDKFVTATDPGNWYESTDAATWTLLSDGHAGNQVAFCDGEFREYASCSGAFNSRGRATAEGVTIRLVNGAIERSTNGLDFTPVPDTPDGLEDVAVGIVPP